MIFKRYAHELVLPIVKNSILRKWLDFNVLSITKWLEKNTKNSQVKNKRVLDIGAGASDYRMYFTSAEYKTCDTDSGQIKHDFQNLEQITNQKFDIILLIEVLEHVKETDSFLGNVLSLLEKSGEIWISLPFNARYHPCPNDYYRWTIEGIQEVVMRNNLQMLSIESRGNTLTTCAQKLLWFVYSHRFVDKFFPLSILLSIGILPSLYIIAHLSELFCYRDEDPQGFLLRARIKRD